MTPGYDMACSSGHTVLFTLRIGYCMYVCIQEERVRRMRGGAGRGTGEGEEGGGMMLDCDRCHRWFHGPSVGIASPEVWKPQLIGYRRNLLLV